MISVAFIYNRTIPDYVYKQFDWIVVESDIYTLPSRRLRNKIISYFSIGEIGNYRTYYSSIQQQWILGTNQTWNSYILDLRNEDCVNFLLSVVENYSSYNGFFLDTLDSYQLVLPEEQWSSYQEGEITLIQKLRRKYPNKIILTNRGFEIFDRVREYITGVVAESLFYGIDTSSMTYTEMSTDSVNTLLPILTNIRNSGKSVIVIDYVDLERERTKGIRDCMKIRNLGFIPYISDMYLQKVGISTNHCSKKGLKRI